MIIDTHAHLNMEDYDLDIDYVLGKALKQEVSKVIVIGMEDVSNRVAIKLAEEHDMLYATVGIHPGYVDDDQDVERLKDYLNHSKVVAIGECGLDFYWRDDNKILQKDVFQKQIELAMEYQKPLVIHTRNSFQEAYDMVLPYKGQITGVFHCFSSDLDDAKKAVELGFMIGIDGPITFKNNETLKKIVEQIDLKHILVETDSPYLTPAPYRGKRNEPGNTRYVVEKIAEIKRMDIHDVASITTDNARRLFHIKED
ncbi:MAG: DNAase [Tenericutes bacterium GWC2_34_14]|nr:MAG: DNAase [Tenericutes bacterium GWC2_34_14]OHE34109.1 MAG: DNAase [Tenericutes bacterium GWE2_34_108]OHE35439.1 MAG: DNAase [Tenericutes bacterium GWF1_35_14]OHE38415.1 MAG: DNAase [Tenericutes bacterium GWF2_35_184]OHE43055.1 MAG: DNAase [Tenericutes bacterium RIFOXYA2_FULL_36_32]OHE45707.1 MAG: DNAase [Tenericutes bacterium RIFOXYA12_FULL_35_10]OHE47593.1 MAG: DNAase [Tenericutes bacterium RIFOXYC2_FULL_35_27]OHE50595.1 MAG: DNAase [Tenericutes bacterium RIFOXYB2_FULL_36_25]OHE51322